MLIPQPWPIDSEMYFSHSWISEKKQYLFNPSLPDIVNDMFENLDHENMVQKAIHQIFTSELRLSCGLLHFIHQYRGRVQEWPVWWSIWPSMATTCNKLIQQAYNLSAKKHLQSQFLVFERVWSSFLMFILIFNPRVHPEMEEKREP